MTLDDIPQELTDYIIDFLQDDSTTLQASSLVCRSWRPNSQRALFRALNVRLGHRSISDVMSFLSSLEGKSKDDRLRDTIPQRHVRDLTISAKGVPLNDTSALTIQDLSSLLSLLPAVQNLRLEGLSLDYNHEAVTPCRLPLDRLALLTVFGVGTRHGLISALLSICSPRSLHLTQLNFDTPSTAISWPVPHISEITTLTLRSRWSMVPILGLFQQGALEDLRVSCYVTSDVRALGDLLAETGHRLKRFSVDLTDFIMRNPNPAAVAEDIDRLRLVHCPSLTDLTFRFSFLSEPWSSLPFNASMFDIAAQITSSAPLSLQTLSFSILLDGEASTEEAYLRPFIHRIETDLSWLRSIDEGRPALKAVVWKWRTVARQSKWGPESREHLHKELGKVLLDKFARLHAKGLLQLQETDYEG